MTDTGCLVTMAVGWAFAIVLGVLTALVRAMLGAWPVMLALGVVHRAAPAVPALGLVDTFVLLFAFGLVCLSLVPAAQAATSRKRHEGT